MMTKTIECDCPGVHEHADDCKTTCLYCGAETPSNDAETVPAIDDDSAWERLAAQHGRDCEWVVTRAHRLV
jgi:hypothetical protein